MIPEPPYVSEDEALRQAMAQRDEMTRIGRIDPGPKKAAPMRPSLDGSAGHGPPPPPLPKRPFMSTPLRQAEATAQNLADIINGLDVPPALPRRGYPGAHLHVPEPKYCTQARAHVASDSPFMRNPPILDMWPRDRFERPGGGPPPKFPPPSITSRVERENLHSDDGFLVRRGSGYTEVPAQPRTGAEVCRNMPTEFYEDLESRSGYQCTLPQQILSDMSSLLNGSPESDNALLRQAVLPDTDSGLIREVVLTNASLEPASEWLGKTIARTTDERLSSLGGEAQTLILNLLDDVSPHMVYHQGEALPAFQTTPLELLFSLDEGIFTPDAVETIGGRQFTPADVLRQLETFFVVIQSSSRRDLMGAIGTLESRYGNHAWYITLDEPQNFLEMQGSPRRMGKHTKILVHTESLGIGLRTRLNDKMTTSIFVHAISEWITNDELCTKFLDMVMRYRPAVYTGHSHGEMASYQRNVIVELNKWLQIRSVQIAAETTIASTTQRWRQMMIRIHDRQLVMNRIHGMQLVPILFTDYEETVAPSNPEEEIVEEDEGRISYRGTDRWREGPRPPPSFNAEDAFPTPWEPDFYDGIATDIPTDDELPVRNSDAGSFDEYDYTVVMMMHSRSESNADRDPRRKKPQLTKTKQETDVSSSRQVIVQQRVKEMYERYLKRAKEETESREEWNTDLTPEQPGACPKSAGRRKRKASQEEPATVDSPTDMWPQHARGSGEHTYTRDQPSTATVQLLPAGKRRKVKLTPHKDVRGEARTQESEESETPLLPQTQESGSEFSESALSESEESETPPSPDVPQTNRTQAEIHLANATRELEAYERLSGVQVQMLNPGPSRPYLRTSTSPARSQRPGIEKRTNAELRATLTPAPLERPAPAAPGRVVERGDARPALPRRRAQLTPAVSNEQPPARNQKKSRKVLPKKKKKRKKKKNTHTRSKEADVRRDLRRCDVNEQERIRTCKCPPYHPHGADCMAERESYRMAITSQEAAFKRRNEKIEADAKQRPNQPTRPSLKHAWEVEPNKDMREIREHCTDPYMNLEYLPPEVFVTSQHLKEFHAQFSDDRGRLKSDRLMPWVFSAYLDRVHKDTAWKGFMLAISKLAEKLHKENRYAQFKEGGRIGETIHDYAWTEIQDRAYRMRAIDKQCKKFLECKNSTYCKVYKLLDPRVQQYTLDWIKRECNLLPDKAGGKIGDLFEFASLYFIGRRQEEHLLAMIAFTFKTEHGMSGELDAAILYERRQAEERDKTRRGERGNLPSVRCRRIKEPCDRTEVYMIRTVVSEDSITCITCNTLCTINDDYTACRTCGGWTHRACCRPAQIDECERCQQAMLRTGAAERHNPQGQTASGAQGNLYQGLMTGPTGYGNVQIVPALPPLATVQAPTIFVSRGNHPRTSLHYTLGSPAEMSQTLFGVPPTAAAVGPDAEPELSGTPKGKGKAPPPRQDKGKGKGDPGEDSTQPERTRDNDKGKGKGVVFRPTVHSRQEYSGITVVQYDGTDTNCSLCRLDFRTGDMVCRLTCNHLFHVGCWEGDPWSDFTECPNCCGPPLAKSRFPYIANVDPRNNAGTPAARTAARGGAASTAATDFAANQDTAATSYMIKVKEDPDSSEWTAEQVAEWNSSGSGLSIRAYFAEKAMLVAHGNAYAATVTDARERRRQESMEEMMLPNKHSIMMDLGSRDNVIGCRTEEAFSTTAKAYGLDTTYETKKKALLVGGVGEGNARCQVQATIPIAVKPNGLPVMKDVFVANVATGIGADMPAILGANSMKQQDGVICLREGSPFIAFPGPGGYSIKWSQGTKILPLTLTTSGHLVVECDHYKDLPKGKLQEAESFWTDNRRGLSAGRTPPGDEPPPRV